MKRRFPLVLVGVGLFLSLFSFAFLYENSRASLFEAENLPEKIAGLSLTKTVSGEAALNEIASMHGKEFAVTTGDIGYYGNGTITVWVAGTANETIAADMVNSMQARIAEGNSPFTPTDEIQNGARTVYLLDGIGQKHIYFQSKNLVIWLASEPSIADAAIQQILEVYP